MRGGIRDWRREMRQGDLRFDYLQSTIWDVLCLFWRREPRRLPGNASSRLRFFKKKTIWQFFIARQSLVDNQTESFYFYGIISV